MNYTVTPPETDVIPSGSVVVYETIYDDESKSVGAAKRDDLGNWWTTDGEHYSTAEIAEPALDCCDAHVVVSVVYNPAITGCANASAGRGAANFVPLSVRRGVRPREGWEARRDKAFREMGLENPYL